jgi:hypothetical protein
VRADFIDVPASNSSWHCCYLIDSCQYPTLTNGCFVLQYVGAVKMPNAVANKKYADTHFIPPAQNSTPQTI